LYTFLNSHKYTRTRTLATILQMRS
jgi:hypothetical protein